ncbi:GNAT family N-acetyltransferase [Psychrobacillus psychrodurans]|uniref:GNAT family N-acetyltransferase n=1 Tax=Psychrobacillus psychrodurans TaxID=126157 RepID=UPI001F4DEF79|nr:GNAT family N-acetyltransferase [Psychrobacillus psychrodurans]MCK1999500.1 GNAT family N-acetyltransferase [Psychrobacillus psychrodurans]
MSEIINTQNCIIRTVELEDAEALLEISNSIISEGDYFIIVSEELDKKSSNQQREKIQEVLNNENENLIVAEINDVVVGSIVFRSHNLKRLSHTGTISMSISENYRGMGIGKILIKALLDWAVNHPLIEKVSLGVFSTNYRAISLYKSMGFIEEGRKVKEFKINENKYVDDILMYKFV